MQRWFLMSGVDNRLLSNAGSGSRSDIEIFRPPPDTTLALPQRVTQMPVLATPPNTHSVIHTNVGSRCIPRACDPMRQYKIRLGEVGE
jgi:hypothetical protein